MNIMVAHSFEGPETTHPAIRVTTHTILDYIHVKTLKLAIITFIYSNTTLSKTNLAKYAALKNVLDNRFNTTATDYIKQK
jgi:hypothetical protein